MDSTSRIAISLVRLPFTFDDFELANHTIVLYHQPEKMTKSSTEDLEARQANLEALKQQHGID